MNRWIRGLLGFFLCFILGVSQAYAVALGKIEVASHLGEAFFAEVPIELEENENISDVSVELASPADYRILEVYRDPALNAIHAEIKNNSRGVRVDLSSNSVIDAPFFNLVLKVHYGHATLFKKYPVFLNLTQAEPVKLKALPMVSVLNPRTGAKQKTPPEASVSTTLPTTQSEVKGVPRHPAFKLYGGWARIGRYGPMVYGDTITTVARRLRVNDRYTLPQVMMALFNKNRKKFSHGNVNLIDAGTYLDVPKSSEVEEMTPAQAKLLLAKQNRAWNALKKQPRYAAVAEAQKNRYRTRVRVGRNASGVASVSAPGAEKSAGRTKTGTGKASGAGVPASAAPEPMQQAKLDLLRRKNTALQEKLKAAEGKIDALSGTLASADARTEAAAANARIRKLEISLARLQAELDRSRQEAKPAGGMPQWLTYLLSALVILLLAGVGYLLRRERLHLAVASTAASAGSVGSSLPPSREDDVPAFEEVTPEASSVAESAKKPDQATMPMNTQEFEDAFTDSVPDLTESDTAEMEAIQEAIEEEPDPNVDYMAEADVYLRYGMDDEAASQIRMEIRQRPNNADAHIKLIQTLQSKGDQAALDAEVKAGRAVLVGEGLRAFEAAASSSGETEAEMDLGDTLPPTGIEAIDFSETEETATEKSKEGEEVDEDTLVLGEEIDMTEFEPLKIEAGQAGESTLTEEIERSDKTTTGREEAGITLSEESVSGGVSGEKREAKGGSEDPLEISDLDIDNFDWGAAPAAGEKEAIEPDQAEEAGTPRSDLPEPDLDLSGIDMPEVGDAAGDSMVSSAIETSDLDKTIAIDWSGETEALDEVTGGFSTGTEDSTEIEPIGAIENADGENVGSERVAEEEKPAEDPFNSQASGVLDISLEDLKVDETEPPSSDDTGEFTSTVRMTVDTDEDETSFDIGLESVELEAPVEMDIASEGIPEEMAVAIEESGESLKKSDAGTRDPGMDDIDITHELDGLLNELDMDTEEAPGADISPDSLNIDKARSLLAEGGLDEAESLFEAAADTTGKRGDGLIGLAEVAQKKGDVRKAVDLLAEAETLVDDSNREWFDSIREKQPK